MVTDKTANFIFGTYFCWTLIFLLSSTLLNYSFRQVDPVFPEAVAAVSQVADPAARLNGVAGLGRRRERDFGDPSDRAWRPVAAEGRIDGFPAEDVTFSAKISPRPCPTPFAALVSPPFDDGPA
jgi:hypothetical protein